MGCAFHKHRKLDPAQRRGSQLKSREVTITPGTFLKVSRESLYSNYRELSKLGSGAFAQVFLCEHKPTGTNRAVKIIHKSGLSNQQRDPIYKLKEIQILKSLDHPNILKCFEIFEDDEKYYVATEYCSGGDLFGEILKMKKFSEAQAAEVMFQLLSALTYCHDKNVIHRDLKPENILLLGEEKGFTLKVADFGSSCVLDKDRKLSGCFGSAYYVAPEVLKNNYNEKCDIWSLGVIMYILLTGRPPYSGKDTESILEQVRTNPLVITKFKVLGLSEESVDLLKMLLTIQPALRIDAKDAVQHPWITLHRSAGLPDVEIVLDNLQKFNCQSKLKEAVHIFLASQVISNSELALIRKNFHILDKDGDGKITRSELFSQYSKLMKIEEARRVVDEIISNLDQDGDGNIDYTEFLVSCYDLQKNISVQQLEIAFKMFDTDGSGTITLDEIRATLGSDQIIAEEDWEQILKEADQNGDGCIDLKEFISLMSKSVKHERVE